MEHPRTETARQNDDSDSIDKAERGPSFGDASGGNLQRDVGTDASLERVRDSEAHEGVEKQDDIDHGQRHETNRRGDQQPGGNASE